MENWLEHLIVGAADAAEQQQAAIEIECFRTQPICHECQFVSECGTLGQVRHCLS